MLMKPFSTVRKQGKVAEMTVKKCPYCSYEMEFPLREWIFKDLYLDSPLPEFRKYTRKMARRIVCPHCKKQSYFTSFYLWLFISLLVMSYPFFFLFFSSLLSKVSGYMLLCAFATWPAVWIASKIINIYSIRLMTHEEYMHWDDDFTSFD
jgi:hypothetical protein